MITRWQRCGRITADGAVGLNKIHDVAYTKRGIIKLHDQQAGLRSVYASAAPWRGSRRHSIVSGSTIGTPVSHAALPSRISLDNGSDNTWLTVRRKSRAKRQRDMAKQFTRSEIEKNDEKDSVLLILHDKVYNVHSFLNEHPGGEEILLDHKGKDASEDFDDVGHSNDAMELMKKYRVGELAESERKNQLPKKGWVSGYTRETEKYVKGPSVPFYLLAGGIALAVAIIYYIF
ncbi:cytochrome b5 [Anoplolepis gracilipes]|uniref:cytochrome b5 n=1 Tax=Anoplolepis gracilipes TaxID=354296 RepID=UPI003B9FC7B8